MNKMNLDFPYFYDMDYVNKQSNQDLFKVVSLFAGGGGSSTGYRLAGGKVLAINEFVDSARQSYSANYPDTHIFPQDVRELKGQEILDHLNMKRGELDLLDGSPPCASFSTIGVGFTRKATHGLGKENWGESRVYSEGIEQRTDDLFYEFVRILDELNPKTFIAENVRGLAIEPNKKILGSNDPNDVSDKTIMGQFRKLGYKVKYKLLNAEDFGVAQTRTRLIIIGVRKDLKGFPSFPFSFRKKVRLKEVMPDMQFIACHKGFNEKFNRMRTPNNVCYTVVKSGIGPKGTYKVFRDSMTLEMIPEDHRLKFFDKTDLPFKSVPKLHQPGYLLKKDFTDIVFKEDSKYSELSRMSIEELKKIQSFPVDYTLEGSYNQQLERLGRSVPPLLMRAVADNLYNKVLKINE
jgi:DNA (cytosine-5)-methyltransferase 1